MAVNRRDLLVRGGATAAALAPAAPRRPRQAQPDPDQWDHTADVVVIGSRRRRPAGGDRRAAKPARR